MSKMKKMFVSFILDETGSMQSVKKQTISGFNEYVGSLQKTENANRIRFSLTKFNSTKVAVIYNGVKLNKVAGLTEETYQPASTTPLYDAIGRTIRSLEKQLADKKRNVLVVIQTDGAENASKEFTRDGIFSLIEEKKSSGWTFVFMGADQDAWAAGSKLGIDPGNVLSYSSGATRETFHRTARATANYVSYGGILTSRFFDGGESSTNEDIESEGGTGVTSDQ